MAQGSCPTASHQVWDCVKLVLKAGSLESAPGIFAQWGNFTMISYVRKIHNGALTYLRVQNLLPSNSWPLDSLWFSSWRCKFLCNLPVFTGILGFVDAEKQVGWECSGHFYDIICKCCANKMQIKTERSCTAQRWCKFAFNFSSVHLQAPRRPRGAVMGGGSRE